MINRLIKRCSCFVIGALLVAACQRPAGSAESDEYRVALRKVDDSIAAQSPLARKLVEQGLKEAEDSFAFYEYYSRMGKYFCLSSTPDSMVPYIDKVIQFASSPSRLAATVCLPLPTTRRQPTTTTSIRKEMRRWHSIWKPIACRWPAIPRTSRL